ncbi:hypothetical protein HanPSC8_Chr05g0205931 [Helianthus annuus]|nr:hypothetical protein HanPSC8_Chr05g0205931 [Helianthus annuus]
MEFQGVDEIPLETMDAPVDEIWYQDIKEIPSIQLPERALVAAKMSLLWKADRTDKPVYMEEKTSKSQKSLAHVVALYVVAYKREKGKMTSVPLETGEKPWYHQIVGNFAHPKDEDLQAQPAPGAGLKKPRAEPQDTMDIPASNQDDPIDLDSSPEPLLRIKAEKRKKPEGGAAAQPMKKMRGRRLVRRVI